MKVFATWWLEADLTSPLRNGSHIMEYGQPQPGAEAPTIHLHKLAELKLGALTRKKHHKLLLGILTLTK